jgi:hyaluronan synthase
MPAFILISFAMAAVKIWALLTLRQQRWLTRDVAVSAKTKTVGRTGTAATPTAALDEPLDHEPLDAVPADRRELAAVPDTEPADHNPLEGAR